jgi:hypothetical protein
MPDGLSEAQPRGRIWHANQMRVITYGPPWWGRVPCALFCTGVSIALVTANTQDYVSGRATAWVLLPTFLSVLLLMTYAYRVARFSFRADATGVVIRNILTTRHIPVAQITGFDVRARWFLETLTVRVITKSGAFPIGVCMRRTGLFLELRINRLCDIADGLENWRAEALARQAAEVGHRPQA